MKSLRLLSLLFLGFLSLESSAQLGITNYSLSSLGINTSQSKKISAEFKVFSKHAAGEVQLELDAFYNFKPRDYHRFSMGAGINSTPKQGLFEHYCLTIPVSLEVYPLKEFKKLSLLYEVSPEIYFDADTELRILWGIRYTFGS